jgi:formylmethanofuran:tetrahydromethanopterin formyltransferase
MRPGFVVFLLKESKIDMDKVLYVRFRMTAPGLPTIRVASGVKQDRGLYDVVEFLEAMLDGSETDMRLAGPKDSSVARVNYEKLLERVVIATN